MFYFFKKYPSRLEGLSAIRNELSVSNNCFKRFVSNRWLSMGPVCSVVITNWNALKKYFLETEHSKTVAESSMFIQICACLKEQETMLAKLHFILSVSELFECYLKKLQSKSTVIHVLHETLTEMVKLLMMRFVKEEAVNGKRGEELVDIDLHSNKKNIEFCDFGCICKQMLLKIKKTNNSNTTVLERDMLRFFVEATKYLQKKLPLKNRFLISLRCLVPAYRNENHTVDMIATLTKSLPKMSDSSTFIDTVMAEWLLYQADMDIDSSAMDEVDKYWAQVFRKVDSLGQLKYSHLALVVKVALSVSHGQADVERGFSINKMMIGDQRTRLKHSTIVAVRTVKDFLIHFPNIEAVPITSALL